eukprot:m51a1_g2499 hypothetical protein (405) ;mRNA; f:122856-124720
MSSSGTPQQQYQCAACLSPLDVRRNQFFPIVKGRVGRLEIVIPLQSPSAGFLCNTYNRNWRSVTSLSTPAGEEQPSLSAATGMQPPAPSPAAAPTAPQQHPQMQAPAPQQAQGGDQQAPVAGEIRVWEPAPPLELCGKQFARARCVTYDRVYFGEVFVTEFFGVGREVGAELERSWLFPEMLLIDSMAHSADFVRLVQLGVMPPDCPRQVLITMTGLQHMATGIATRHPESWSYVRQRLDPEKVRLLTSPSMGKRPAPVENADNAKALRAAEAFLLEIVKLKECVKEMRSAAIAVMTPMQPPASQPSRPSQSQPATPQQPVQQPPGQQQLQQQQAAAVGAALRQALFAQPPPLSQLQMNPGGGGSQGTQSALAALQAALPGALPAAWQNLLPLMGGGGSGAPQK